MAGCSAKFVFGLFSSFLSSMKWIFCHSSPKGWKRLLWKGQGALYAGKLKYAASWDTFSPEYTFCFQNKHWHNCIYSVRCSLPSNYFSFPFCTSLLGPVPTDWISGRHRPLMVLTVDIGWYGHIPLIILCLSLLLCQYKLYTHFPLCFYSGGIRALFLAILPQIVK